MGKGAIPEYSWWNGEKLNYIEARKKIYIPIYARAVIKSSSFEKLLELYKTSEKDIYLLDFDGYNHIKKRKSIEEVINDPKEKMGHGFVIWMLLIKYIGQKENKQIKLF